MATRSIDLEVLQRLAKGFDLIVLAGAGLVITTIFATGQNLQAAGFFALLVAFASLFVIRGLGLYQIGHWDKGFVVASKSLVAAAVTGGSVYYLAKLIGIEIAKDWMWFWFVTVGTHFAITRMIGQLWSAPARNQGQLTRRVAIVGGGQPAEDALKLLEQSPDIDVEIVGLFDDRFDNRSPDSIRKHRKLGSIAELSDFARNNAVDLIIVAIPLSAETRLLQILKRLWELPVDIRISGAAGKLKLARGAYSYIGALPLLSVFERPLSGWDVIFKDIMDRTIATLAIIGLSPVMAAVAIAVRYESKGPIIFKQKRFGFNNELVEVFKFRSMYTDMSDAAASKLVTKDDPRVTRVGRFIRKTSLDELPQLFNVLLGTLSLVGPRPHATQAKAAGSLYDEVVDGYFARHKVKPGITGWAQINGWRGETDTREKIEQRVKHDLEYIDSWSLGFDLYILGKTPLALLKSENAY